MIKPILVGYNGTNDWSDIAPELKEGSQGSGSLLSLAHGARQFCRV